MHNIIEHKTHSLANSLIQICEVCLEPISEAGGSTHNFYKNCCVDCGELREMAERLRRNLEYYKTHSIKIKYLPTGKSIPCPNCGAMVKIYGTHVKTIECRYCRMSFQQLNSGDGFIVRDTSTGELFDYSEHAYKSQCPFDIVNNDNSIKMESDKEKLKRLGL